MAKSIQNTVGFILRWLAKQQRGLVLYVLVLLAMAALCLLGAPGGRVIDGMERWLFDVQMQLSQQYFPRAANVEPVLIGIDAAAEEKFPEPIAMWHQHLGKTMQGLALAKPLAVGMDINLPDRSFDAILPGLDLAFIRGLVAIKAQAPLAVALGVTRSNSLINVHAPFLRMLGDEAFGLDKIIEDPDRVPRQFYPEQIVQGLTIGAKNAGTTKGVMLPFDMRIAEALGRKVKGGFIDYAVGGTIDYVPITDVVSWVDSNPAELTKRFAGKVVLIGYVNLDQDRWQLPVALANWEKTPSGALSTKQPGVMVHHQILRGLLGDGLLQPIAPLLFGVLIALLALLVFVGSRTWLYAAGFIGLPLLLMGVSLLLIQSQILLPLGALCMVVWLSLAFRGISDSVDSTREKNRLKVSFAGSVSPAVMQEMLEGGLSAGVSGQVLPVCVLFSDIRGFTQLAESLEADKVTNLLTLYFDRMVKVVHANNGTIDKFMGDGMMALFGAPKKSSTACFDAVNCALQMHRELAILNTELKSKLDTNDAPMLLEIGVGINYGGCVVGNIGSTERHNYSAIGDTVNVASRVEGITKRLGSPIVITPSVMRELHMQGGDALRAAGAEFIDHGPQPLRGHTDVSLWGVRADFHTLR
jgi:adenylate cyclase